MDHTAQEEITLDFHPLRVENISIGQESWTFAPQVDLRVLRGDPRRGRAAPHEVNAAIFQGPFVAQALSPVPRGGTAEPTWAESVHLRCTKAPGRTVGPRVDLKRALAGRERARDAQDAWRAAAK